MGVLGQLPDMIFRFDPNWHVIIVESRPHCPRLGGNLVARGNEPGLVWLGHLRFSVDVFIDVPVDTCMDIFLGMHAHH